MTLPMTMLQRAVLDALGNEERTVSTLAFDMGITDSAVRSRLYALWHRGEVERTWRNDSLVWFAQ